MKKEIYEKLTRLRLHRIKDPEYFSIGVPFGQLRLEVERVERLLAEKAEQFAEKGVSISDGTIVSDGFSSEVWYKRKETDEEYQHRLVREAAEYAKKEAEHEQFFAHIDKPTLEKETFYDEDGNVTHVVEYGDAAQ